MARTKQTARKGEKKAKAEYMNAEQVKTAAWEQVHNRLLAIPKPPRTERKQKKIYNPRQQTPKELTKLLKTLDPDAILQFLIPVLKTNDVVSAQFEKNFFPANYETGFCLMCRQTFHPSLNRDDSCKIQHTYIGEPGEHETYYLRGECPGCAGWDCCDNQSCGICTGGKCGNGRSYPPFCYKGPHVTDENQIPRCFKGIVPSESSSEEEEDMEAGDQSGEAGGAEEPQQAGRDKQGDIKMGNNDTNNAVAPQPQIIPPPQQLPQGHPPPGLAQMLQAQMLQAQALYQPVPFVGHMQPYNPPGFSQQEYLYYQQQMSMGLRPGIQQYPQGHIQHPFLHLTPGLQQSSLPVMPQPQAPLMIDVTNETVQNGRGTNYHHVNYDESSGSEVSADADLDNEEFYSDD